MDCTPGIRQIGLGQSAIISYEETILPPYTTSIIPEYRYSRAFGALLPRLYRLQYSGRSGEIKSHLSEECIQGILDEFGKPCPIRPVV